MDLRGNARRTDSGGTSLMRGDVGTMTDREKQEAKTCLILGLLLSDVCGPASAVEMYQQALIRDPSLVAAHFWLGISRADTEDYREMIAAFQEAIRLDPLAAGLAAGKLPEELESISRILHPQEQKSTTEVWDYAMPSEFVLAGDLVTLAKGYLARGRADVAIEALEHAVKIDPTFSLAIALLSFTDLLLRKRAKQCTKLGLGSVLREVDTRLATLLFSSSV